MTSPRASTDLTNAVDTRAYQPQRTAQVQHWPIRTLAYQVRSWGITAPAQPTQGGTASAHGSLHPPVLLLHGWMDVGASYQFVVDALPDSFLDNRALIAPDWRGFGGSRPSFPCDHHAFVEYLADLDALIDHIAGDQPVDLVGHSMGGNVVMAYAGSRPHRVRRVINLEGFGLPATQADEAPARLAQWMDEIKALNHGTLSLKPYASPQAVAQRLMKTNPRLSPDKALWLATQWAAPNAQGQWELLADVAHKVVSAHRFQVDEMLALYRAIAAPVLSVQAGDDSLAHRWGEAFTLRDYLTRLLQVPNYRCATVPDSGHMLHHDQPHIVANLIAHFLTDQAA
jgi:pimeloyl-ACP methyl ester carboxylesterase